jgi:hypothetical protein
MAVRSEVIDGWAPGNSDSRRPFIEPGPVERWIVLVADGVLVADAILSGDAEVASSTVSSRPPPRHAGSCTPPSSRGSAAGDDPAEWSLPLLVR